VKNGTVNGQERRERAATLNILYDANAGYQQAPPPVVTCQAKRATVRRIYPHGGRRHPYPQRATPRPGSARDCHPVPREFKNRTGRPRGSTVVLLCSWHAAVACGTCRLPALTTWLPQPCTWSSMNAATMLYDPLRGGVRVMEVHSRQLASALAPASLAPASLTGHTN
jgi:hypothetical protein